MNALLSGSRHRVNVCGIPYVVKVRDNELHFFEDGMSLCRVMIVSKQYRQGLINVTITQESLPACHVTRAAEIAEQFIGPNHYATQLDLHRHKATGCLHNAVSRSMVGWRLGWRAWSLWRALFHWWKWQQLKHAAEAAERGE